jgi:hypothetical protein
MIWGTVGFIPQKFAHFKSNPTWFSLIYPATWESVNHTTGHELSLEYLVPPSMLLWPVNRSYAL